MFPFAAECFHYGKTFLHALSKAYQMLTRKRTFSTKDALCYIHYYILVKETFEDRGISGAEVEMIC